MPKPHRRSAQPEAPQPGQLAAVRRALEDGNAAQARQRLAALRESFPGFKPLRALAWEVESQVGEQPMLAAARAYDWQAAAPGSRAAVEALHHSAAAAGLHAVSLRAGQRLRALDGATDLPPLQGFDAPLGRLSFEQAEAIDLARMHLADGREDAAIAVLQGVDHPSARNNLALAQFVSGRVAQAREVAEAGWQALPANLFALERALRWRCWAEGLAPCLGFVPTLREAVPGRAEDAIARIAALRFLGETEAARQAVADTQDAPYWSQAKRDLREMFEDLAGSPEQLPADDATWFPRPWRQAMAALARESRRSGEAAVQARWDARLGECEAHADYLERAAELGDGATRLLALAVLKQRAKAADAAAIAGLRRLLTRPCGPDAVRMGLLDWLAEQGLQPRGQPIDILAGGRVRTTRSYGLHIHDQPRPIQFPPQGQALHQRVHRALGRGALREALELAQQLRDTHPGQPAALNDLAAIRQALGAPVDEVAALYRQARELAPDYVFARCGLARCLAELGQVEEARALLEGVLERSDWHHTEYRSLLLAQRALAQASHDEDAVHVAEQALREMMQRFAG